MKAAATTLVLLACAAALGACGSQVISVAKDSPYYKGAVLFRDHCSGCHTLAVVGAEGSATSIANRVKTNGPNFNIRKENEQQVLYAIRNGGFSGAIMPENILVGPEAVDVARFLAKYSGLKAQKVPKTTIKLTTGRPEAEASTTGTTAAKAKTAKKRKKSKPAAQTQSGE
jgi:mono/diheme cytochrome c family protein